MERCMIVETRDPIAHRDVEWMAELALAMKRRGLGVAVLLAENGALAARTGTAPSLQRLVDEDIAVSVDRFALEERGIAEAEPVPGVEPCEIGIVVDQLAAGASVLWR
jgi:hypothetical protein